MEDDAQKRAIPKTAATTGIATVKSMSFPFCYLLMKEPCPARVRRALIEIKAAGEEFEVPETAAEKPKVVDLMAALEASVAAAKEARGRHPSAAAADAATKPAKKRAAKKSAGRKSAASSKASAKSRAKKTA